MSLPDKDAGFILVKAALKKACLDILNKKLNSLNQSLQEINESSNQESKSSAGDKHETTKALMHIEQEKLGKQIELIRTQIEEVEKIQTEKRQMTISNGSVIQTDQATFYIAAAIGKTELDGKDYFIISIHSPIAQAMIKSDLKKFDLNGKLYVIKELL